MLRGYSLAFAICFSAVLGLGMGRAHSAELTGKEVKLRAAFLFRLAFFLNWPESAFASRDAPIVFCISGDRADSLPRLLAEQTATRSIQGRPVSIRTLVDAAETSACHVLYSNSAGAAVGTGNTVAVVDSLSKLATTGVFALVLEERDGAKLQFYVHRERLQLLGVNVSAQLLQLVKFYEPAD